MSLALGAGLERCVANYHFNITTSFRNSRASALAVVKEATVAQITNLKSISWVQHGNNSGSATWIRYSLVCLLQYVSGIQCCVSVIHRGLASAAFALARTLMTCCFQLRRSVFVVSSCLWRLLELRVVEHIKWHPAGVLTHSFGLLLFFYLSSALLIEQFNFSLAVAHQRIREGLAREPKVHPAAHTISYTEASLGYEVSILVSFFCLAYREGFRDNR